MNSLKKIKYFFLIGTLALLNNACSPESSGLVGYSYHNITAKYNAYFIAREKLNTVTEELEEAYQPNFNKTLLVFSPIDTNIVKSDSAILADVIKKASIAIQRHEVSKWVDDSYILVGKARYLNRAYEEAIETFKYVNVKSENKQTQFKALINLIRVFIDYKEFNNAQAVIDYLSRKKLDKQNRIEFYLHAANYAQQINDPNNLIKYLNAAVEIMPSGRKKAKIHFILGQLFQKAGLDAFAYKNYEDVTKNNPPYKYFFHARLNMAQVTELSEGNDVKKIRKYFEQLLKDGKNIEFKDKIYYEMAEFERKQGKLDDAIKFYKSSARESVNNQRQKSFAYHKLGVVYFDELKEYALAKAYYDSASKTMPRDEEIYEQVAKRQEVLAVFVDQINTIEKNDSLIAMAGQDSITLNKMFTKIRDERIALEKEEDRKRKKEARNKSNLTASNSFTTPSFNTVNTSGKFYFYDPGTIASGRSEFKRVWGNRSLQDNWRFESSSQPIASNDPNQDTEVSANANNESVVDKNSPEENLENEREAFFASIPFDDKEQEKLLNEIEEALYILGNIYNFDLKEKKQAVATYNILLERFPQTTYEPEILYLLYVYYKDKNPDKSKSLADQLTSEFPETIFAKLIINPNYQEESNIASAKVKIIYEKAYLEYNAEAFKPAMALIEEGLNNYPENDYEDNLKLLEALVIGKTEDRNQYLYYLQQFVKNYPESELFNFANELLKAIDDYEQKIKELDEIKYIPYFDQSHYFVVIYKNNKALSGILPDVIEDFAKKFYPNETLNAGNLIFNDQYALILLSEFKDQATAESFYRKFNSNLSPLKDFSSLEFENFVISKDNFQIYYQSKVANSYNDFFKTYYKLKQ